MPSPTIASGVAGARHGGQEILGCDTVGVVDSGLLGRVVDAGAHPVELVQLLLDARRAGSAGHAADGQLKLVVAPAGSGHGARAAIIDSGHRSSRQRGELDGP